MDAGPAGETAGSLRWFCNHPEEHIQLDEDTVWLGEERDWSNPEAPKALAEIRLLLVEGHPAQAQALADKTMISILAVPVYETLDDLWLDFGSGPDATESHRASRPRRGWKSTSNGMMVCLVPPP